MFTRRALFGLAALMLMPTASQAATRDSIAASLRGQHPSAYYQQAIAIFKDGKRDDAVFIFYLGQLRYRTHILARNPKPGDAELALFSSLQDVVGRSINEYGFGDIAALDQTLKDVAAFDQANPDTFTPRDHFPEAHADVRQKFAAFRKSLLQDAENIRAKRNANGLENRTQ